MDMSPLLPWKLRGIFLLNSDLRKLTRTNWPVNYPTARLDALLNHEKARKEDRVLKAKSNKMTFSPGDRVMVEKKSLPLGVSPKLATRYTDLTRSSPRQMRTNSSSRSRQDVIVHVRRLKRFLGDPPEEPTAPDPIESAR